MVTETLDKRLLQIVKEQHNYEEITLKRKCKRLLTTLKEAITQPIDVFYILSGGSEAQELYVDDILGNPNTMYLEPHIINYDGKDLHLVPGHSLDEVMSGRVSNVNPQHFALLVDDSWNGGTTVKKTVKYLENLGYEREKIFVFHYLGSNSFAGFRSERHLFVFHNPVLTCATTMLDFFDHPLKY